MKGKKRKKGRLGVDDRIEEPNDLRVERRGTFQVSRVIEWVPNFQEN